MKVFFYCRQFYPSVGGLENVAKDLASELSGSGWEVIVATEIDDKIPNPFAFKILRKAGFWRITKEMRQSDCIVMFNVSLKGLFQQVLSNKPLIIYHQSGLFYPGQRKPFRQYLKKWVANYWAKKNIACSRYIGNDYKNVTILLNPYDDSIFRNLYKQKRPNKFLFVGRLVSDKGCDILIEAFSLLVNKLGGSFTLTIIGDGNERLSLQAMINKYALQDRIFIKGYLTGELLAKQMNLHEIMIVPSRWEPFGIVALEGMACGCRMIVSDAGGLPEAVGSFANLFETGNVISLVDAMAEEMAREIIVNSSIIESHLAKHCKASTSLSFKKIIINAT